MPNLSPSRPKKPTLRQALVTVTTRTRGFCLTCLSPTPPLTLPTGKLLSSSGLGDRDYKDEGLLICEPEVTSVVLQPHVDAFRYEWGRTCMRC